MAATSPPSSAHRSLASVGHRLGCRIFGLQGLALGLRLPASVEEPLARPPVGAATRGIYAPPAARPPGRRCRQRWRWRCRMAATPYGLPSRREVSPSASLLKAW